MGFDEIIDRRGTWSMKWDQMQARYDVSPQDGLSMWVADTDFRAPPNVLARLTEAVRHGVFGYVDCSEPYEQAIRWWMAERHGWNIEPSWIFTTTGLVNAIGLCLDAYTKPGDGIVVFAPVYHAFHRAIRNAGRKVVELPLTKANGCYRMDFHSCENLLTGDETMVILCSPHNPGGRVWTRDELRQLGDFARRHDLLLVSDEIHHDLVLPGNSHLPLPLADPSITDRLIMLTAPSKTFNLAGLHTGNVIIENPQLRERFDRRIKALSLAPNSLGQFAVTAAYSPDSAAWLDELMIYIDGNRNIFDSAVNAIPGLRSMHLEATFLAWVDFSGTGMSPEEFTARVEKDARIATNHGSTFGLNGENFLRFNLGTQRVRIEEACERLTDAFRDLR